MEFTSYHKTDDTSHIASLLFGTCNKRKMIQLNTFKENKFIKYISDAEQAYITFNMSADTESDMKDLI